MASISNVLVAGLMNPAFGRNVAPTVAGLGGGIVQGREQGRARVAEEQKQKGMLDLMQQASSVNMSDPTAREGLFSAMREQNISAGDGAAILQAGQQIGGQQAQQEIQKQLQFATSNGASAKVLENIESGFYVGNTAALMGTLQSQQETSQEALARQAAGERATKFGVLPETIAALGTDDLNALSSEYEKRAMTARIDGLETRQARAVQAGIAGREGASEETLQNVRDGVYDGDTDALLEDVRGTDTEAYQVQAGKGIGQVVQLPTRGGQVKFNNKWVDPSAAGLVKAPSRTQEGTGKFTRTTVGQSVEVAAAFGTLRSLVGEIENVFDAQLKIVFNAINPLNTDFTQSLAAAQKIVPDALVRLVSGSAVRKEEMGDFTKLFAPTFVDVLSPQAIATKLIRSGAMLQANSLLSTGEISPAKAREMVVAATTMGLTNDEKALLKEGKFKQAVSKRLDSFAGEGPSTAPTIKSQADFEASGLVTGDEFMDANGKTWTVN